MHQVIVIVVEADSIDEAVNRATDHFDNRLHYTECDSSFDCCQVMDTSSRSAGASRYEEYTGEPLAFEMSSDRGAQEVKDAWELTKAEFRRRLAELIEEIASTDENVYRLMESFDFRYVCKDLSRGPRTSYFLYYADKFDDGSGSTIESPQDYRDMWEDIRTGDTHYAVPLDAHS